MAGFFFHEGNITLNEQTAPLTHYYGNDAKRVGRVFLCPFRLYRDNEPIALTRQKKKIDR